VGRAAACGLEARGKSQHRDHANGNIDEENPVPAEHIDKPSAHERTDDRRDREHSGEYALNLAAVLWRDDVADHREGQHEEATPTKSLNGAGKNQKGHVCCDAAENGAEQEQANRGEHRVAATVEVSELSVKGGDDGGR
jgi:hypothetical protein